MALSMKLIEARTAPGSTGTITFSSIPQTYKHLKLIVSSRHTLATSFSIMYLQMNGDTANNYSATWAQSYNSGVTGIRSSNTNAISGFYQPGASATASAYSSIEILIPNYKDTAFQKQVVIDSAQEHNSTANSILDLVGGLWRNTSAITSLTIIGDTYTTDSKFYLYGIN